MSTQPFPVTTETVKHGKVSTFLITHERLIIVLSLALLLFHGYLKTIDYLKSRDQVVANKTQAVLQAQVEANKQAFDNTQQAVLQYKDLVDKLMASNAQIASAQAQRAQVTQKQQTTDKMLPPPELAARWNTLLKMPTGVAPAAGNTYAVTQDAAVQTVVELETVPSLQADLAGEQILVSNGQKQIDGLSTVNAAQITEIAGLGAQIQDQDKACTAQINLVKAQSRKSKIHWFEAGFVVGFVVRQAIKFPTGL
jgi:hypothetical protein